MAETTDIGNKAERLALRFLKKKYPHKMIVHPKRKEGCDFKVGRDIFVEVKGTTQSTEKKNRFMLGQDEFLCACKNKGYMLLWVNTKTGDIKKIDRECILGNTKPRTQFMLQLTKEIKSSKNERR